jgi:hypothetical protein
LRGNALEEDHDAVHRHEEADRVPCARAGAASIVTQRIMPQIDRQRRRRTAAVMIDFMNWVLIPHILLIRAMQPVYPHAKR